MRRFEKIHKIEGKSFNSLEIDWGLFMGVNLPECKYRKKLWENSLEDEKINLQTVSMLFELWFIMLIL